MRILHLTESFWPRIGGMEIFVEQFCRALQLRGHTCLVVSNQLKDAAASEEINGLPILRLPFTESILQRNIHAIASVSTELQTMIKTWKPDLIHLHSHQAAAFFYLRLRHAQKIPAIYTTHSPSLFDDSENPLMKNILSSVERVVAVSKSMYAQVIREVPQAAQKTSIVYNGLQMPSIHPMPLPENPHVIFSASRLTDVKGLDILLRSLPAVLRKFPDLKTIIAGNGPSRTALQTLSVELKLSQAVSFPGWIHPQQVPVEINRATLVVVPSLWQEPFGLIAAQALQMARPVVASDVGGIPEIVIDQETGLLVPPNDVEALCRAILQILENPTQAKAMGQHGRERTQRLFGWERCITAYESLYGQMLI